MRRLMAAVLASIAFGALSGGSLASQAQPPDSRITRVVLLVDSSTNMAGMLTQFRSGLNLFLDVLPPEIEVTLISTGGQIRIRVPPTTDRERLHREASRFASDGGANSLLDTVVECDERFLKKFSDRAPVFVILTSDSANYTDPVLDRYNSFMNDFRQRRGHAHGIVVSGKEMGLTGQIVANLTQNTSGYYERIAIANSVPERMKMIAARVAAGQ